MTRKDLIVEFHQAPESPLPDRVVSRPGSHRIPARQVASWEELEGLVTRMNALLAGFREEVVRLKQTAQEEGHAQGKREALMICLEHMLIAQESRRLFVAQHQDYLKQLALRLVEQVLPELPDTEVVGSLLNQAIKRLNRAHVTRIVVAPDVVASLRSSGQYEGIAIESDPRLSVMACVVESEHGVIQSDINKRLKKVADQFTADSKIHAGKKQDG